LGFRVKGIRFRVWVWGLGSEVLSFEWSFLGCWLGVQGLGFRDLGVKGEV